MRALLLLFAIAGTAYAQPPGQVAPMQPGQPIGPTPGVTAAPTAPKPPSVIDRPWSVELNFGWIGLSIDDETQDSASQEGIDPVTFGMAELAGRYRFTPNLELGLTLIGGGAMKGDASMGGLYIDGRYRFLAERSWNPYAYLSLGIVSVARDEGAMKDEDAGRGSLRAGIGLEKRFPRFGVHADLRFVAIGKNKDWNRVGTDIEALLAAGSLSGGSLIFGGTVYF
jgi:hypothetical protein